MPGRVPATGLGMQQICVQLPDLGDRPPGHILLGSNCFMSKTRRQGKQSSPENVKRKSETSQRPESVETRGSVGCSIRLNPREAVKAGGVEPGQDGQGGQRRTVTSHRAEEKAPWRSGNLTRAQFS